MPFTDVNHSDCRGICVFIFLTFLWKKKKQNLKKKKKPQDGRSMWLRFIPHWLLQLRLTAVVWGAEADTELISLAKGSSSLRIWFFCFVFHFYFLCVSSIGLSKKKMFMYKNSVSHLDFSLIACVTLKAPKTGESWWNPMDSVRFHWGLFIWSMMTWIRYSY